MLKDQINYTIIEPGKPLQDYVKFFWHLTNHTNTDKKVIILPDGYFDIIFFSAGSSPFKTLLAGLSANPQEYIIPAHSVTFAISFKLMAAEYILNRKIGDLINTQIYLPNFFWDIEPEKLSGFKNFADAVSHKINTLINGKVDDRKKKLFDIVYTTNGLASVQQISDTVYWSPRQINRYFTGWFGLTLKKYCNILRYRASFKNLKEASFSLKKTLRTRLTL